MTNWFQTEECLKFYGSLAFIEPFECSVERDGNTKGRIVGYIQKDGGAIKRFFSKRAIINGGPLLADDITEQEVEALFKKCQKLLNGRAIYAETRNFSDYSNYRGTIERTGWKYEPHYDIQIECSAWPAVEDRIGKHRKKYIRLSLRDGAAIVAEPTLEQVHEFYSVLSFLYKTKVKSPLWPLSFFESLYKSEFGRFFLVEYQGHIIGGSACVVAEDCVYEWFACGKDGEFKNIHPSSLTKYAGLQYAAEHGIRFDMMGAGAPGDGGYGVRDFKLEFGGELLEFGRFKCVLNRPLYLIGTLGVKILKKLK